MKNDKSKSNKKKTTPKKAAPKKTALLDTTPKKPAHVEVAEPEKKSSGELSDDEYREIINETGEYVRGEFLSDTFKAKMTISITNVTFNTACVKLFKGYQHVSVCMDAKKQRLLILAADVNDPFCLKFANVKNDQNVPRICTTRTFCIKMFLLMGWNQSAKYRILAIYKEIDGKKVIAFNLDEAQQVITDVIESEDGKKKRKTTVIVQEEWINRFGYRKSELDERMLVELSEELVVIDTKSGDGLGDGIEPKPPTAEELILKPYGNIRPRKKEKKDDK